MVEASRASAEAQARIEREVNAAQREARSLFAKIRLKTLSDACEQSLFVAGEARSAIRLAMWPRAAERVQEARQLVLRLLNHRGVTEDERQNIRNAADELKSLGSFIERNRLVRGVRKGIPKDKLAPLEFLLEQLEFLRARLNQQFWESPDGNE